MLLWFLFAVLTAAVLAALLRPLWAAAPRSDAADDVATDVAVYRQQLAELDTDLARGLIDPSEAESARREVARRLIARADVAGERGRGRAGSAGSVATLIAAVLPVGAIAAYLALGQPNLPDQPRSAVVRAPIERAPVDELVARVEARLASHPDDGQGWDVIAPVYFRLQRFGDAAKAYARAGELLGETTTRLAGFAEATVMASDGVVTEPARRAYERLAAREPERIEPKFWLALAMEQDGRRAEAAAAYRALLATAPPDAAWRATVEERLAAVGAATVPGVAAGAAVPKAPAADGRGPSAGDVKAAEQMSARERAEMIGGMVEGLARRLAENPKDLPGWQRLVRAYAVLGDRAKAGQALSAARGHFVGDAAALAALGELARTLGLGP